MAEKRKVTLADLKKFFGASMAEIKALSPEDRNELLTLLEAETG